MSCSVAAAKGALEPPASLPIIGTMDDLTDQQDLACQPGRKWRLWSHDVLFAMALTVMAISFIGIAWFSGGTRSPSPVGQSTAVTTK